MTTETDLETCISEYLVWLTEPAAHVDLAGFVGGELDPEQADAVRTHLASCNACAASLAAFNEVETIWEAVPPRPRRSFRLFVQFGGGALAAAAATAVLVAMLRSPIEDGERLQPKGSFDLLVAVDRGGKGAPLRNGGHVQTGDRLGFFYTAGAAGYLAILYGADSGEVERLYPSGPGPSVAVLAGREVRVPDGAVISAGQGCEWIVGLFSKEPLSSRRAKALVKKMIGGREACTLMDVRDPGLAVRVVGVQR